MTGKPDDIERVTSGLAGGRRERSRETTSPAAYPTTILRTRKRVGPASKLLPEQRQLIVDFLWHGAEAYGFHGDVWTCGQVAQVIKEEWLMPDHR